MKKAEVEIPQLISAVTLNELSNLKCTVTVLQMTYLFQPLSWWEGGDWMMGTTPQDV